MRRGTSQRRSGATVAVLAAVLGLFAGYRPPSAAPAPVSASPRRFGAIDTDRLARAVGQPGEWYTSGGDGSGGYFSHLEQINDRNAGQLGFAWDYALHTSRGLEATPIVVDGTLYTSGNWGRVYALDAATGR